MALPIFRSVGAKASGTGAVSPALPASMVSGDICILVASTIAGGTISITANGSITTWTPITGSPVDVAAGEKIYVWWGLYSSGSTAPTVTPGSDHCCAGIAAYSGCASSPINNQATGTETVSDTTLSFVTGISTTVNDCIIILCSTSGNDGTTAQHSAQANTNLSSIVERMDYLTNSGGGGGFQLVEGARATAGAIGTWTTTLATASPKAYITFALKPPQGITVTPNIVSFITTKFIPIAVTSNNKTVVPNKVGLASVSFAPILSIQGDSTVIPDLKNLNLSVFVPLVSKTDNKTVIPATVSLSASRFIPLAISTANKTVVPPTKVLTSSTFATTIITTSNKTVVPNKLSLLTNRFISNISASNHKWIIPQTNNVRANTSDISTVKGFVYRPNTKIVNVSEYIPSVNLSFNHIIVPDIANIGLNTQSPQVIVFTSYGLSFNGEQNAAGFLEVYMRAIQGTVYAQLINLNTKEPVDDSRISTTNTSFEQIRSAKITFIQNNNYRVQLGKEEPDSGEFLGVQLIIK